jgi:hypothetical protein
MKGAIMRGIKPSILALSLLAFAGCAGAVDKRDGGYEYRHPDRSKAADKMQIEVTITDNGYEVEGYSTPGTLTSIYVRNKGTMTHGFVSPLFKAGILNKEGGGKEIGKEYRGYHLDPGEHMTLTFTQPSTTDPATGIRETTQVPFWCDIHTHMRGEFLVLETRGEVGGG